MLSFMARVDIFHFTVGGGPINRKRSWLCGEAMWWRDSTEEHSPFKFVFKDHNFCVGRGKCRTPLSGLLLGIRKLCKWDPRSSLLWLPDCFSLHTAMMMASFPALRLATPLVIYLVLSKTLPPFTIPFCPASLNSGTSKAISQIPLPPPDKDTQLGFSQASATPNNLSNSKYIPLNISPAFGLLALFVLR